MPRMLDVSSDLDLEGVLHCRFELVKESLVGREVIDVVNPHYHDEEIAVGQFEKYAIVKGGDGIPGCFENGDEMVVEVPWSPSHSI